MDLESLGWNNTFEKEFEPYRKMGLSPARVVTQQGNNYILLCKNQYINGRVSGKFKYNSHLKFQFPAVGDWVGVNIITDTNEAIIQSLLPRMSYFLRKLPISGGRKMKNGIIVGGSIEEQVLASNIDTIFIVNGLDDNFSLRRIERYLTLAYNCSALPVIILNKMDLCSDVDAYKSRVEAIAFGVPVYPISVSKNIGMEVFNKYLSYGKTNIFIGSSGVGKSTIINYLLGGNVQRTNSISWVTGKGRHTTTSRELLFHPCGGMVIDTPGIRELQLWGEVDDLERNFEDIIDIASKCKFKNCTHNNEPGCEIHNALEDGTLSIDRYDSYRKQFYELRRLDKNKIQFERNFNRKAKQKLQGLGK